MYLTYIFLYVCTLVQHGVRIALKREDEGINEPPTLLRNGRRRICQPEYMISTGRNFHKIYIASDNHH